MDEKQKDVKKEDLLYGLGGEATGSRLRVVLSQKSLGELDEDQLAIYERFRSSLSLAFGRDIALPEARAKLDFLVDLDLKRVELAQKCVVLRENARGSYEIARKQLTSDPKYKGSLQRGIEHLKSLIASHMEDPKKAVLKIDFFNETRKLTDEEIKEIQQKGSETPERIFTGIQIATIVLDSGETKLF